jgi:RsiW-degrading membrane proteinase PrsW (M82 family)
MRAVLAASLGLVPVAAAFALWHRSRATRDIPRLRAALLMLAAYCLGWICHFAEFGLLEWTGLSLAARSGQESEALLAMFLFVAPLEEGAKVLAIWPLYSARRLLEVRHGLVLAAVAGAGFAAGDTGALLLLRGVDGLTLARALVAIPPHVVCAAIWGSTLGARARTGGFALAWIAAAVLHGLFDHIVFGRGPGVMVLAIPLLLTMLAIAYAIARRSMARERGLAPSRGGAAGEGAGWSEPPSIREVWAALEPRREPLLLHWIALGMLVTAGLCLTALAAGLYVGHWIGLDFAAADEADVRSNGPLLFLATSVGSAFPVSGYLVARASGTRSVLEPALGAALAVLGAVLFLSATTPIAAAFALAVAPIAFVLASGGAWFATSP